MRNLTSLFLTAILICGCGIEEQSEILQDSRIFTASFEEGSDTKVYIESDLSMHWTASDRISVFTTSTNDQYSFSGSTGDTKGDFAKVSSGSSGSLVSTNYAVFPYNASTSLTSDEKLRITLPAVQNYAESTFGISANTMVAVTSGPSDTHLAFRNLCGYLVVKMYGNSIVKSVSISGNNGEKLSGNATVTAKYGQDPTLVFDSDAGETITVDCGDGVALGADAADATEFWFCIPPVSFSKGFTVTAVNTVNGSAKVKTSVSRNVQRNHKAAMAAAKTIKFEKAMPPVTEGAATTGQYRNYLLELGISQENIDKKIREVYDTMFNDPKFYVETTVGGKKMAYVSDVKNDDVRSEGMSYGMMVAVQMDDPTLFNKLWRWANKYMRDNNETGWWGKNYRYGLYNWKCNTNGSSASNGSASDGELYFVTDLLLAARRWGSYEEFDYLKEAQNLLTVLFSKDGTGNVTNIINMEHKLINFCPDSGSNNHTDPSYHVPAFFEIWAETASDGREDIYREIAANTREYLHKCTDSVTGINPDQSYYDGTTYYGYGWPTWSFVYDSWRVPMNIAMDFSWYHKDAEWQADYATRMVNTVVGRYGLTTFPDQYALNGDNPASGDIKGGGNSTPKLRHSIGFVGTMATTSLMIDGQYSQDLVHHMFEMKLEPYSDGYYDVYYDGFHYLFALLHLSGNYRMDWD